MDFGIFIRPGHYAWDHTRTLIEAAEAAGARPELSGVIDATAKYVASVESCDGDARINLPLAIERRAQYKSPSLGSGHLVAYRGAHDIVMMVSTLPRASTATRFDADDLTPLAIRFL